MLRLHTPPPAVPQFHDHLPPRTASSGAASDLFKHKAHLQRALHLAPGDSVEAYKTPQFLKAQEPGVVVPWNELVE